MVLVFYFSIIKEHSGSKYGMCLGIFTNTFAEQGGANHGGEGRPWTGASSSLPCHPRQQVTINGLSSCQQVKTRCSLSGQKVFNSDHPCIESIQCTLNTWVV